MSKNKEIKNYNGDVKTVLTALKDASGFEQRTGENVLNELSGAYKDKISIEGVEIEFLGSDTIDFDFVLRYVTQNKFISIGGRIFKLTYTFFHTDGSTDCESVTELKTFKPLEYTNL